MIKRKVKGITYIYERTTDKDGKRHERVIGRLDEKGQPQYYETGHNCTSGGQGRGCRETRKEDDSETYPFMAQNQMTNLFNKVSKLSSSRGSLEIWDTQATYTQGNLTISMPHYDLLLQSASISKSNEINIHVKKVLDITSILFTQNGHKPNISFSIEKYMELCGLNDEKEARKQINAALEAIYDFSLSYDDSKKKNRSRNYFDMRICDFKAIKKGIVYLRFAEPYATMLADCPVMPYPVAILKASKGTQHRNSFYMARKIIEHKNMNIGKSNENIISVRTLLEAAPNLATEEEVQKSDRRFTDRIITPFFKDLEEALSSLKIGYDGYELQYENGTPIPSPELQSMTYETFINAYVRFDEPPDYPDMTKRLEAKAERAEKAKEKAKKKKKKETE